MISDLLKDLTKYAPAQIVPALMALLAVPILTRIIQPIDYGKYFLVISTISVLSVMVGWLSTSLIRYYPGCERDGRLDELFKTIVGWLLITITFMVIICIGALFFAKAIIGSQLYRLMLIGLVVFALSSSFEVLLSFLRAKRLAASYTLFSSWRAVAGLGIGIVLVTRLGFGVDGLLWGSVVSLALVLPLLWKYAVGRVSITDGLSVDLTKEMARYGFPLVAANLAAWMLDLSDRYILGIIRGAHEVGVYSTSYTISGNSILLIVSLFYLASRPISMTLWENEGANISSYFVSSVTRYYLLVCVPAVIGMSVLAQPIMEVLVGAEYREGFRIIPIIALSGLLIGLQHRFQEGIIYYKKTSYILIAVTAGGIVNVGLNMLLIPKFGYIAAACTTLIGYAVVLVITVITSRIYFMWTFPTKSLIKAVFASIVMSVAVYPIGNSLTSSYLINLLLAIPLGALLYLTLLFLLGEIQPNEKKALKLIAADYLPLRIIPADWRRKS